MGIPFLLISISVFVVLCITNAFASDISQTINIKSEHANYDNHDAGAWNVNKSVTVKDMSRVEVKIDVDSIIKGDGIAKDVLFVVDTSGSMADNGKIDALKSAMLEVGSSILANPDNLVGLVEFNTTSEILSEFTNNWDTYGTPNLSGKINALTAGGGTNYYQAILKMEELFSAYDFTAGRQPIVLFFTDGAPIEDNPSQIPEYQIFKNLYPDVPVRAIQYDMGTTINPAIAQVSDVQYVAQIGELTDVMFNAIEDGYRYTEFTVDDFIDSDYFTFASYNSDLGTVTYDSAIGKIHWDLSQVLRSGRHASLSYNLDVTQDCIDNPSGYCKTSEKTEITSKIPGNADEHVVTTDSPSIRYRYDLTYDVNSPSDCTVQGTAPSNTTALIYSTQEFPNTTLTCEGYEFKGWGIGEGGAMRFNDDYFQMPEANTVIRAAWSKNSIEKSMDGEVAPVVHAMLRNGWDYGQNIVRVHQWNAGKVQKLKSASELPADFDTTTAYNFSVTEGLPIYIWYDDTDHSLVYYSDADVIDINPDGYGYFDGYPNLTDISILANWDASKATTLVNFFRSSPSIENYDAVKDWDVSHVTNMGGTFNGSKATDLDALKDWDTSHVTSMANMFQNATIGDYTGIADWETGSVTNMYAMFYNNHSTDLSGFEEWDTSAVTNMQEIFRYSSVPDFEVFKKWDTSNVTNLYAAFNGCAASSLDGLEDWDVSKITSFAYLFENTGNLLDVSAVNGWDTDQVTNLQGIFKGSALQSLSGISDWDTSAVTTMEVMFQYGGIVSMDGAEEWDVKKVTTMANMFSSANKLNDISGMSEWKTNSLTNLVATFYDTKALKDISPLKKWDVSHVTNMNATFQYSGIEKLDGLEDWQTGEVLYMHYMFYACYSLTDISALADWNVKKVQTMAYMFSRTGVSTLHGLETWEPLATTNMEATFANCSQLTNISALADWNVESVQNMSSTFASSPITSISCLADWRPKNATTMASMFNSTAITNVDGLNQWNVGKVTSMNSIFYNCTKLENVDGLNGWNTTSLTNLSDAFHNCTKLEDISGLGNWNISHVTTFVSTFFNCMALTQLEDPANNLSIGNWTLTSATDMSGMFLGCKALTDISALGGWDVSTVKNFSGMFQEDSALQDISPLATWVTSAATNLSWMFWQTGITSLNGLQNFVTTNVTTINRTFGGCSQLTDVSAIGGWDVAHVTDATFTFISDTNVMNFSPLDPWQTESFNAHSQNTFYNTNANAVLPSWY